MKIVTVVGAYPQFIKAVVVSFFQKLDIPKPNYNLGISGGMHEKVVGEMLIRTEEVLMKEKPEVVLLYGDTNSTLAGALAAAK